MTEYEKHRKFIHDFSNEMAITEGGARRALNLLPEELKSTEIEDILEMTLKHSAACIKKLKEYRTFIHQLEKQTQSIVE